MNVAGVRVAAYALGAYSPGAAFAAFAVEDCRCELNRLYAPSGRGRRPGRHIVVGRTRRSGRIDSRRRGDLFARKHPRVTPGQPNVVASDVRIGALRRSRAGALATRQEQMTGAEMRPELLPWYQGVRFRASRLQSRFRSFSSRRSAPSTCTGCQVIRVSAAGKA